MFATIMTELAAQAQVTEIVMIDATHAKAHRRASSLGIQKEARTAGRANQRRAELETARCGRCKGAPDPDIPLGRADLRLHRRAGALVLDPSGGGPARRQHSDVASSAGFLRTAAGQFEYHALAQVRLDVATLSVARAATFDSGFILGAPPVPGNPCDGHTLAEALEQVEILTGRRPALAVVDRGYRGHPVETTRVLACSCRPSN